MSVWQVNAVELTHNIALAIEKEKLEDQPTPIANQVFDSIDVDKDGYIDVKELVNYVRDSPKSRALFRAAAHELCTQSCLISRRRVCSTLVFAPPHLLRPLPSADDS